MTLQLTLKRKWFEMIAAGEKREEYRAIKSHWLTRLYLNGKVTSPKDFADVTARNGYASTSPRITWKHEGIRIGKPNPAWCDSMDRDKIFLCLKIGEITSINGLKLQTSKRSPVGRSSKRGKKKARSNKPIKQPTGKAI